MYSSDEIQNMSWHSQRNQNAQSSHKWDDRNSVNLVENFDNVKKNAKITDKINLDDDDQLLNAADYYRRNFKIHIKTGKLQSSRI